MEVKCESGVLERCGSVMRMSRRSLGVVHTSLWGGEEEEAEDEDFRGDERVVGMAWEDEGRRGRDEGALQRNDFQQRQPERSRT